MARIQDAPYVLVVLCKGVGFVEQKGGAHSFDGAEEGRRGDASRSKRARHQSLNGIEQCRLAAARQRGRYGESGKYGKAVEKVRSDAPERGRVNGSCL